MNQCEKRVCKLYTMLLLVLYAHISLNTHFSFCVCIYFKHKQRQYAPQRLSWTRLVPISICMHKVKSRETSNRKYLSKTILACRERQAKKTSNKEGLCDSVHIEKQQTPPVYSSSVTTALSSVTLHTYRNLTGSSHFHEYARGRVDRSSSNEIACYS